MFVAVREDAAVAERAVRTVMKSQTQVSADAAIAVTRLGRGFAARLDNISLADGPCRHVLEALRATWLETGVILLRGQALTKHALVAFSELFGVPEKAAAQERELTCHDGPPEVMIVSNVIENGRPIGHLGAKEAFWHTDMCYMDAPPDASALYAVEAPETGGDTSFMDMNAVYRMLPTSLKARIASVKLKHDRSYTAVGDLRYGYEEVHDPSASPGAIHPLVRHHPVTGQPSLYLGRRLHAYVQGLSVADSECLLDELWSYTVSPDLIWRHAWRPGDLLIWDNRRLMHKRDAFDASSRRVMWRTQMQPYPE